jgi:hypothetical protein
LFWFCDFANEKTKSNRMLKDIFLRPGIASLLHNSGW